MNNLKKIGLSALAGSMVAFSAQALEMSVGGTAKITYVDEGEGSAGNVDVTGTAPNNDTHGKFGPAATIFTPFKS